MSWAHSVWTGAMRSIGPLPWLPCPQSCKLKCEPPGPGRRGRPAIEREHRPEQQEPGHEVDRVKSRRATQDSRKRRNSAARCSGTPPRALNSGESSQASSVKISMRQEPSSTVRLRGADRLNGTACNTEVGSVLSRTVLTPPMVRSASWRLPPTCRQICGALSRKVTGPGSRKPGAEIVPSGFAVMADCCSR